METATRDDVRLTLALDGPPRVDAASWATLEIENLGASGVRWAGGGCGDPGSISIDLRPAFAPGRDWPGLLGRFKAAGLGDGFENPAAAFYVAADRFGQDIACAASLQVEELAPGATLELRAGWDGTFGGARAHAPTGPVVVTAAFAFIGIAGEVANEDTDTDPIEVHIQTTVAGVAGAAPLSPALAIDAALADPQFAAWVQASPEDRWINPSIDLLDGAWSVGLFRLGAGAQLDLYGAVTIDAMGTIIGRRFDP